MAIWLVILGTVLMSRAFYIFDRKPVGMPKIVTICLVQILPLLCCQFSPAWFFGAALICAINLPGLLLEKRTDNLLRWRAITLLIFLLFWTAGVVFVPVPKVAQFFADLMLKWQFADKLAAVIFVGMKKFAIGMSGFLLTVSEANLLLQIILQRLDFTPKIEQKASLVVDNKTFKAGRIIGMLERALVFIFVLNAQFGVIGFVLVAKGITRFKELDKRSFAEYVLIGTLMSLLCALILALITNWMIEKI